MKAIHQLVAGFTPADAISNEALELRALFRRWGYVSEIFCEPNHTSPDLRAEARAATEAPGSIGPADIALLHLSIGSRVNDIFEGLNCRKALRYHNITPAHFFRGLQEELVHELAWGREQTRSLAKTAAVNLAVSSFNAAELTALGYADVRVVPLVLDFRAIGARPDSRVLRGLRDGRINILFVGRCVPNKRIEDALLAFFYFQKFVESAARFIHVGSFTGLERYQALLSAYAARLRLDPVVFSGTVTQNELSAYYQGAHLFLCMSEHEGFCIPLIESMAHDLPILAYAAGAVPETLSGAGVLVREKKWEEIAEMMGQLVRPGPLREAVLAGERQRLERYRQRDLSAELKTCLTPLLRNAE
ncbi:MAG: glycosyltransferase family 4 protein [Lentisphaerae bacterium]|nr:glycosyltransferase family 4 protein [Lentisphaerota bacterium]